MRKNILSLSIAAMIGGLGFAGAASAGMSVPGTAAGANTATATNATALSVTPDGIGHILLVPYFSTQNGNSTLLSIVNTDPTNGKAVKVRFRGASNSDDIFDFQIYMSPSDVWTAEISKDAATGLSKLTTADNTCTAPKTSVLNSTKFITTRLPTKFSADELANQTREGYVEIFNMADIPPFIQASGSDTTTVNTLYTAIKHVSGVAPCTETRINTLNNDSITTETAAVAGGLNTPSTGLTGSATIINVAGASVAWSGNSTAIVANTGAGTAAARGRIVFSSQTNTAQTGNVDTLTNDPLLRTAAPKVVPGNYDLPDLSTPYVTTNALVVGSAASTAGQVSPFDQAETLSTTLAVKSVSNEYLTNPALAASTDWTFSMPTRRYHTVVDYSTMTSATAGATLVFNSVTGTNALPSTFFSTANSSLTNHQICVDAASFQTFDQSEQTPGAGGPVISPGIPTKLNFCGEVSVLGFNSGNVLGATVAKKNLDATYTDGWATITTTGLGGTKGLPILGSAFQKATGPLVSGKSTNFSLTLPHRVTR